MLYLLDQIVSIGIAIIKLFFVIAQHLHFSYFSFLTYCNISFYHLLFGSFFLGCWHVHRWDIATSVCIPLSIYIDLKVVRELKC